MFKKMQCSFKECSKSKLLCGLLLPILLVFLIIFSPGFSFLCPKCRAQKTCSANCNLAKKAKNNFVKYQEFKYKSINNKALKKYLIANESKLIKSSFCHNPELAISYYKNIHAEIIKSIVALYKNEYISEADKSLLLSQFKKMDISNFITNLIALNLLKSDNFSVAEKNYILGLAFELSEMNDGAKYFMKSIEDSKYNEKYHMALARHYEKKCDHRQALECYSKALIYINNISTSTSKTEIRNAVYTSVARLYGVRGDMENALAYYSNALVNYDLAGDSLNKSIVLSSIADIMIQRGDYFDAINNYKYALSLLSERKHKSLYVAILLKLSNSYYQYGNYSNGLKFAQKAYKIAKKSDLPFSVARAKYSKCLNLEYLYQYGKARQECEGAVYLMDNLLLLDAENVEYMLFLANMHGFAAPIRNYGRSLELYKAAFSILEKEYNPQLQLSIAESILATYHYMGKNAEALTQNITVNELKLKYGIKSSCCNSLNLGDIHLQNNPKIARMNYLKALEESHNRKSQQATIYSRLSDAYKNEGMYKLAIIYGQKALEMERSSRDLNHHYVRYHEARLRDIIKGK